MGEVLIGARFVVEPDPVRRADALIAHGNHNSGG